MTNYNERLDKILSMFDGGIHAKGSDKGGYPTYFTEPYPLWVEERKRAAKQANTSLIKELVAEAKPRKYQEEDFKGSEPDRRKKAFNRAIDEFEQNLLKALESK